MKIPRLIRPPVWALPAMTAGSLMLTVSVVLAQLPASRPSAAQDSLVRSDIAKASALLQTDQSDMVSEQRLPDAGLPAQPSPNEHPLMPALRWAGQELPAIESLKDYSATLVKRERVNGRLGGFEYMSIKVRHKPFSVYVGFLAPATIRGQEVLYVAGQNQGKMWAHKAHLPGTVSLHPDSLIAMSGRRYPLTEIGLVNLVRRLVEVGLHDIRYGECEVKFITGAKINKRLCTVIQVVHPVLRQEFRFHLARVFVDDELRLPIRYEAYDWPREPGGQPELTEEYTYLDLKLNNRFTDEDFSIRNPKYRFR